MPCPVSRSMHGAMDIATTVAERSEVAGVEAGSILIEQASSSNDLYFIIAGLFAILVNGREIARRRAERACRRDGFD